VIKYGGNAMLNNELKNSVIQDIALMKYIGLRPVVVHGGGPEITALLKQMGKQSSFVSGLRVTDEETMAAAEMVLAGKINTELVAMLNTHGAGRSALNGTDPGLIKAASTCHRIRGLSAPRWISALSATSPIYNRFVWTQRTTTTSRSSPRPRGRAADRLQPQRR
jgi:acetylglutamate kinase